MYVDIDVQFLIFLRSSKTSGFLTLPMRFVTEVSNLKSEVGKFRGGETNSHGGRWFVKMY